MAERKNRNMRQPEQQPGGGRRWVSIVLYTIAFGLMGFYFFGNKENIGASKGQFMAPWDMKGAIEKIEVSDDLQTKSTVKPQSYTLVFGTQGEGEKARGVLVTQVPSIEEFSKFMDGVNGSRKEAGQAAIDVTYNKSRDYWYLILVNILPFVLIVLFFVYMSRGIAGAGGPGGIFGVGKAQAQLFDKDKKDKVTFQDVAGDRCQNTERRSAGRPSGYR